MNRVTSLACKRKMHKPLFVLGASRSGKSGGRDGDLRT